jgi:hypothetical protein
MSTWYLGPQNELMPKVRAAALRGLELDEGLAEAHTSLALIERHGVDPDMVVDNLPHNTFTGSDAQLEAAMDLLKQEIQADPRPVPKAPPYPNKSFRYAQWVFL